MFKGCGEHDGDNEAWCLVSTYPISALLYTSSSPAWLTNEWSRYEIEAPH